GQEVPVFDELEILLPSEFGTFTVTLDHASTAELEQLINAFAEQGLAAENWATDVRFICQACSEGRPHEAHRQHAVSETEQVEAGSSVCLAIAAVSEQQINDLL